MYAFITKIVFLFDLEADHKVIEVDVEQSTVAQLYRDAAGVAHVRLDGSVKRLTAAEEQDWLAGVSDNIAVKIGFKEKSALYITDFYGYFSQVMINVNEGM